MEFLNIDDNGIKCYDVSFDANKLEELLNEIVRNGSYRTNGTFVAPYDVEADVMNNKIISGATLPNGDPIFENIIRVYNYTYGTPFIYNNESINVKGTKVTPPYLAFIIKSILSGDKNGISRFVGYKNSDELISIDDKIASVNKLINETSNFDFDKKIDSLNVLKSLCNQKKTSQYFDAELLKKYYLEAWNIIKLEVVEDRVQKRNNKQKVLKK